MRDRFSKSAYVALASLLCFAMQIDASTLDPAAVRSCEERRFLVSPELKQTALSGVLVVIDVTSECDERHRVELIQRNLEEDIEVRLMSLRPRQLKRALEKIHRSVREISANDACDRVALAVPLDGGQKEQAAMLLGSLRDLRIRPILESPLYIHGVLYSLTVVSGHTSAQYEFAGAPFSAMDSSSLASESGLGEWVAMVMSALNVSCAR